MIYTPLYIKTDYSLLNSLIKIDDLISFALKNNIKALSITDNNLSGVMEFYEKCKKNNIKPIIGLNINIDDNIIILYAKNYDGYLKLLKINTLKEENNLKIADLTSNDLICIIPFEYKNVVDKIKIKDLFIGYKNKEEEKELKENKIYLKEILYLEKEDYKYLKYVEAIKDNTIATTDKYLDNYLYLEQDLDYDLTNNYKIYDMCNVELKFHQDLIPKYDNSYEVLKKECIEGLKNIFGNSVGIKYKERLKYELSVINDMHFCDYFLVVKDYVNKARELGILVGPGRGSAAGSLVSYLLGIIEIDPLKYDLLFERFLNKERVTLPDIDIDFDGDRIDEVIDYCKDKYGRKRVANIVTYSSLTTKQVLRDVGSTLGIDSEEVDYFTRMFKSKMSLMENYNNSDVIQNQMFKNKDLKELFDISLKLENIKKHISIHASGVVIASKDLDEVIPLIKYKEDYLTGYQAEYLENIGLIKMDFLALKTLSFVNKLITNIKDLDYNNIPLNDKETINIFRQGNTLGIFQFESGGMIGFLRQLKVNSFNDVYNAMALYRPGPMNNIEHFIKRKDNLEEINYFDESLENILKPTYGIIVYQEQIMQIANIMASYSLGEADILRRAMSKKKENILKNEKEKFISRSIKNGYSEELANEIYDLIYQFAQYGFNKSHAVAYSIISYKIAYIKAHYPSIFMKILLDEAINSSDINIKIMNSNDMGVKVLNPDINKSVSEFIIENDNLIYPLTGIKNVNMLAVDEIIKNRPYNDIFDSVKKINLDIVSKESILSLIKVGAFDQFNKTRKTLIENLDIILNYAELISDLSDEYVEIPNITDYEEYKNTFLSNFEYESLGFYLNNHPVAEYRKKYNNLISINSLTKYLNKKIHIIVKIDKITSALTQKKEKIIFLNLNDEYGNIDGVIFENVFKVPELKQNDIVDIYGRVNRRNGQDQIIINDMKVLD